MAYTACHDLDSSLDFVSVQVDEESAMSQVVGRDSSEELAVIVIFIVSVGGTFIEPTEIINDLSYEFVTLVYLV